MMKLHSPHKKRYWYVCQDCGARRRSAHPGARYCPGGACQKHAQRQRKAEREEQARQLAEQEARQQAEQAELAERTAARLRLAADKENALKDRRAKLGLTADQEEFLSTITPQETIDMLKSSMDPDTAKDAARMWYEWASDEDRREFDLLFQEEKRQRRRDFQKASMQVTRSERG